MSWKKPRQVQKCPSYAKTSEGLLEIRKDLVWSDERDNQSKRRQLTMVWGLVGVKFPHLNTDFITDERTKKSLFSYLESQLSSR